MIDLNLRHLRSFLAVAGESSITRAAARQHITQQTLSVHLQTLERALGVTLMVRTSRGVALTPAGEVLAGGARDWLDELEGLAERVRDVGRGGSSSLRVVTAAYTMTQFAIEVAAAIEAATPGAQIEVATAQRPIEAMERMHAGLSDASLMWLPTGDDRLLSEAIRRDQRAVLVAADHRLAGRESVALEELAEDPVVIVDAFASAEALSQRIIDPRPDGRPAVRGPVVPTLEDCLTQVRRGNGVWFAPRQMAEWAVCPGVTSVPVTGAPAVELAVVWRAGAPMESVRRLVVVARRMAARDGEAQPPPGGVSGTTTAAGRRSTGAPWLGGVAGDAISVGGPGGTSARSSE